METGEAPRFHGRYDNHYKVIRGKTIDAVGHRGDIGLGNGEVQASKIKEA